MSELGDYGHTYLECSNCQRKLVDVWVTQDLPQFQWKVQSTCPYCPGERSFVYPITGAFRYAGYGVEDADGLDVDVKILVNNIKYEGDLVLFQTALPLKGA